MVDFAELAEQRANQKIAPPQTSLSPPSRSAPKNDLPMIGPSFQGKVSNEPQPVPPMLKANQNTDQTPSSPSGVNYADLAEKKYLNTQLDGMDLNQSGASASLRAAVGSAVSPEDRLKTLRKTHPDAIPYGSDNFVFPDPDTGELTQFNPSGFDLGDIAGAAPEIGEFVGGTLGGIAGSAVAPGAGTVVGTGLGAAAGRGIVQEGAEWLLGTEDNRDTSDQVTDLALTGGLNAVGAKIAPMIGSAAKQFTNAVKSPFARHTPEELVDDYASLGVTPSAGQITNNRFLRTGEQILPNTPGGAPIMQRAIESQNEQLTDTASRIASMSNGSVRTTEDLGDIVKQNVGDRLSQQKAAASRLYDKAYDAIGDDARVNLNSVAALRNEIAQQVAEAPHSAPAHLRGTLSQLDGIIKDSSDGGYGFGAARRLKSQLDEMARAAPETGNPAQGLQKRLSSAIGNDLADTVNATGGQAAKLYEQANRYYAKRIGADKNITNRIVSDKKTAQSVGNELLKPSPDPQTIRKLRGKMSRDEWNDVVATKINRMGMSTAGQQNATGDVFSSSQFLTNWNRMPDNAKQAMFGGSRYSSMRKDLDKLARISSTIKEGGKVSNPSGTAHHMAYMTLLGGLGYGISEGDTGGIVGTLAAGIVAPNVAARLMTNPSFVGWLSKTPKTARDRNGIAKHLAQLYMIGELNPEIKGEVNQFMKSAKEAPIDA